jgi:hypothetical protein
MKAFFQGATRLFFPPILVCVCAFPLAAREKEVKSSQVTVQAGLAGCQVEIDSKVVGETNAQGNLITPGIEPGDHYVHVHCSDGKGWAHFISPKAGQNVVLHAFQKGSLPVGNTDASSDVAKSRVELRRLMQQALRSRAQGKIDEAVDYIRQALKLDPENSDLHRELGITFLLDKDWKRARVEMIEAIRHDRTDADAHNGLGYALEKLGDLDGAVKEYRMATRLEPDDPTYRTRYFDALAKLAGQKRRAD